MLLFQLKFWVYFMKDVITFFLIDFSVESSFFALVENHEKLEDVWFGCVSV